MRFLIAFAFLAGCGDSMSGTDSGADGGTDAADIDSDVDAEPCGECDTVDFFIEVNGEPLEDGLVVDWVWGFQGGTMITPTIVFTNGVTVGETVEVEVRHEPDPAAPELFGQAEDFRGPYTYFYEVWQNEGRLIAGPIDDQLGWIDLDGMRLIHSVRVRAARGTTTRTSAIEMATSEPSPCDVFELEAGGCAYYVIPGSVTVTIGDPDPIYSMCNDARSVTLTFTADAMADALACVDTLPFSGFEETHMFWVGGGYQPPAGCLDAAGLTEGATLRATYRHIRTGTCSPTSIELEADTSTCDTMCM